MSREGKCSANIFLCSWNIPRNRENRNAGFFIYIDLSPYLSLLADSINVNINGDNHTGAGAPCKHEREFALAQRFLDAGVFLHPGEEHGKAPGWFRLVFSHEEEVLEEGLRR